MSDFGYDDIMGGLVVDNPPLFVGPDEFVAVDPTALQGLLGTPLGVFEQVCPIPEIKNIEIKSYPIGRYSYESYKCTIEFKNNYFNNLEDNWFWGDFLKYFKVYGVVAHNQVGTSTNIDLFLKQSVEEIEKDIRKLPVADPSINYFEQSLKDVTPSNKKLSVDLPLFFVPNADAGSKIQITFVCYLDIQAIIDDLSLMENQFYGATPSNLLIDVKDFYTWDSVFCSARHIRDLVDKGGSNSFIGMRKVKGELKSKRFSNPEEQWSSNFRPGRPGSGYDYEIDEDYWVKFEAEPFKSLVAPSTQRQSLSSPILDIDLNKELPVLDFSGVKDCFSDPYFSKKESGQVEVFVSFDYFSLLKKTSYLPDEVFEKMQEDLDLSSLVRGVRLTDSEAKLTDVGKYVYSLEISTNNRVKEFLETSLENMNNVLRMVKLFKNEVKRQNAADQYGILSEEFIQTGEDGSYKHLLSALNEYYSFFDVNYLDLFSIQKMRLKKRRILNQFLKKESFNQERNEVLIADVNQNQFLDLELEQNTAFTEFAKPDLEYEPGLEKTREEFLDYYSLDSLSMAKVGAFENEVKLVEAKILRFLDLRDSTKSSLLVKTGGQFGTQRSSVTHEFDLNGVYDADSYNFGVTFQEPSDVFASTNVLASGVLTPTVPYLSNQTAVLDYGLATVDNLSDLKKLSFKSSNDEIGSFVMSDLTENYGIVFESVTPLSLMVEGEKAEVKKDKQIEVLDSDDEKNVFARCNEAQKMKEEVLSEVSLSIAGNLKQQKTVPDLQMEYLSGYEVNSKGVPLMKKPIFLPVDQLPQDQGVDYLYKAVKDEKSRQLSIYNEYFIKR